VAVDAIHAKGGVVENAEDILPQIQEMRESILCVDISPDALKRSPYCWKTGEEPKQPGVTRVTLHRIAPSVGIQTEE
jgi:hypothetical protein